MGTGDSGRGIQPSHIREAMRRLSVPSGPLLPLAVSANDVVSVYPLLKFTCNFVTLDSHVVNYPVAPSGSGVWDPYCSRDPSGPFR